MFLLVAEWTHTFLKNAPLMLKMEGNQNRSKGTRPKEPKRKNEKIFYLFAAVRLKVSSPSSWKYNLDLHVTPGPCPNIPPGSGFFFLFFRLVLSVRAEGAVQPPTLLCLFSLLVYFYFCSSVFFHFAISPCCTALLSSVMVNSHRLPQVIGFSCMVAPLSSPSHSLCRKDGDKSCYTQPINGSKMYLEIIAYCI